MIYLATYTIFKFIGCHKWASNENYEGNWFHDFRHGYGKYQWYDSNVYFGMFFMNNREGYGHLMYSSGDDFKVNLIGHVKFIILFIIIFI